MIFYLGLNTVAHNEKSEKHLHWKLNRNDQGFIFFFICSPIPPDYL